MNCDTAFSKFTRSIFKKRPKHLGCKGAEPRAYWTLDEFIQFRNVVADKPEYYYAFEVLYWTGMRMGEIVCLDFNGFAGFVKIDAGRFLPFGQSGFHVASISACSVKTGAFSRFFVSSTPAKTG